MYFSMITFHLGVVTSEYCVQFCFFLMFREMKTHVNMVYCERAILGD